MQNQFAVIKSIIDRKQMQEIVFLSPAFQWAQSPDEIYLNVKFSHKLDAPATLNVQHNITFESDRLFLIGSNGLKSFKLDLLLLRDIIPDQSGWSSSSNGRITITMRKDKISKWARLVKDNSKKPSNMHFWLDKNEIYKKALDDLEDEIIERPESKSETSVVELSKSDSESTPDKIDVSAIKINTIEVKTELSDEEKAKKIKEDALKKALEDLETEKSLRVQDASRRAQSEKAAIERDIAARKKELLESSGTPDNEL
jgi:hypothetical protein